VIFGSKSPHRPPTRVAGSALPRCRIQPGELEFFTSCTNRSAPNIGCKKGTGFQSTDHLLYGASSRTAGNGCADLTDQDFCLAQGRDLEL